jgi:hypothetical protein
LQPAKRRSVRQLQLFIEFYFDLWLILVMPKAIDFRITGLSFEQAGKRLATAKPEASKPAPKRVQKRKKR